MHFFDRLFIESSPLRTDYPEKPREIYQLLSILLSVDNSKYRHPFSYIYNSYFLGKTSSKEAVDLFGKLLPGGISYSDGLHIRKKHVEDYKDFVDTKTFRDSLKADVLHVFDDNGVYKQGTGGQGINSSSIVSVWTNRLLILKKDGFIQRYSKHSMRS